MVYISIATYRLKYQQPVHLEAVIPPSHINSSSCDLVSLFMFNKSSKHLIMHAAALQAPYCDMQQQKIACVEDGVLWLNSNITVGEGVWAGGSPSINQVCQITRLCDMISICIIRGVH